MIRCVLPLWVAAFEIHLAKLDAHPAPSLTVSQILVSVPSGAAWAT